MSAPPDPATGRPYVTPECRVGRLNPGFRHGCPTCQAPGYEHPVLKWVAVECACECHQEAK